jgi:hypothetical protein
MFDIVHYPGQAAVQSDERAQDDHKTPASPQDVQETPANSGSEREYFHNSLTAVPGLWALLQIAKIRPCLATVDQL